MSLNYTLTMSSEATFVSDGANRRDDVGMNTFYVYEHWRLDRDECFYVGKGKCRRAYSCGNRSVHWKNIVSKLERTGFAWEVRIVASGLNEEAAFALEAERIAFWRDIVDLANKAAGGGGSAGYCWTLEQRNKIKGIHIGRKHTNDARAKISAAKIGHRHTVETRAKISSAKFGVSRSPETIAKISASLKGKPGPWRGKKLCSETRAKMSKSHKAMWAKRKEKTT